MKPTIFNWSAPSLSSSLFSSDIESIFDDALKLIRNSTIYSDDISTISGSYPRVNIYKNEKEYTIELEIAGIKKEQISIEVKNNTICVKGEKQIKKEYGELKYSELKKSSFIRNFPVNPEVVNIDKMSAEFEDGILSIKIPLNNQENKKSRFIDIK